MPPISQPPILILELSNHSMQSCYSRRVRDMVRLIPIVLLMLVVILIMLIMRMMLVITNIKKINNHIHSLEFYGDHSILRGDYSWPHGGC